jgi:hypothetical protein
VRRLAIAHQARDVGHGDRQLLQKQLGRDGHAPCEQILAETHVPELGVCALQLPGRAGQGAGEDRQGELSAVVARHDHAGEQI